MAALTQRFFDGKLKSFDLVEDVKNASVEDFPKINYKQFYKLLADFKTSHLIYAYSGNLAFDSAHFAILKTLKEKIGDSKLLKIVAIDHDRNDLDGKFDRKLPKLFLITEGKRHRLKTPITFKNIVEFVNNSSKKLKKIGLAVPPEDSDL